MADKDDTSIRELRLNTILGLIAKKIKSMTLICNSSFLLGILTGVIGNIIFALLLIGGFQQLRYYFVLKRKFHNKSFNTYWKRFPDDIVQTVSCSVKRNVVKFKGNIVRNGEIFEGEIIMNPINLKIGEGFHTHQNSDGYGFLKVIIKDDNTFFVEAPYTGVKEKGHAIKEGFRIYQAFIWKRE